MTRATGTVVHIPYSQSSAGDLWVQLYCCTVPDFPSPLYEKADLIRQASLQFYGTYRYYRYHGRSEFDRSKNLEFPVR